jgi:hypothetical protein
MLKEQDELKMKLEQAKKHIKRGDSEQNSGNFKDAIRYYTYAIDLIPKTSTTTELVANVHLQRGNAHFSYDEASYFKTASLESALLDCKEAKRLGARSEGLSKLYYKLACKFSKDSKYYQYAVDCFHNAQEFALQCYDTNMAFQVCNAYYYFLNNMLNNNIDCSKYLPQAIQRGISSLSDVSIHHFTGAEVEYLYSRITWLAIRVNYYKDALDCVTVALHNGVIPCEKLNDTLHWLNFRLGQDPAFFKCLENHSNVIIITQLLIRQLEALNKSGEYLKKLQGLNTNQKSKITNKFGQAKKFIEEGGKYQYRYYNNYHLRGFFCSRDPDLFKVAILYCTVAINLLASEAGEINNLASAYVKRGSLHFEAYKILNNTSGLSLLGKAFSDYNTAHNFGDISCGLVIRYYELGKEYEKYEKYHQAIDCYGNALKLIAIPEQVKSENETHPNLVDMPCFDFDSEFAHSRRAQLAVGIVSRLYPNFRKLIHQLIFDRILNRDEYVKDFRETIQPMMLLLYVYHSELKFQGANELYKCVMCTAFESERRLDCLAITLQLNFKISYQLNYILVALTSELATSPVLFNYLKKHSESFAMAKLLINHVQTDKGLSKDNKLLKQKLQAIIDRQTKRLANIEAAREQLPLKEQKRLEHFVRIERSKDTLPITVTGTLFNLDLPVSKTRCPAISNLIDVPVSAVSYNNG